MVKYMLQPKLPLLPSDYTIIFGRFAANTLWKVIFTIISQIPSKYTKTGEVVLNFRKKIEVMRQKRSIKMIILSIRKFKQLLLPQ